MAASGTRVHIDEAIDSYARRIPDLAVAADGPPYDSESLAKIYEPRVRQLFDLQNQGFTHAEWKWDDTAGHNCWHGVAGNLNGQQFGHS